MFDCKSSVCGGRTIVESLSTFAKDGGLSFAQHLETGAVHTLLGIEVHHLYGSVLYDIAKAVRDRIQKNTLSKSVALDKVRAIRSEITTFLRFVLGSAPSINDSLFESISIIQNCLPLLINPILRYGWKSVFVKEFNGYEILHSLLEWRWLLLLIVMEATESTGLPDEAHSAAKKKSLGELYRELIEELLELVLQQFCCNAIEDVIKEKPFMCLCVQKMWVGMMAVAAKSEGEIDFWQELCKQMPSALKERKDGYMFKMWVINALAYLNGTALLLDGKAVPIIKNMPDETIIVDIFKELVDAESREEQVRCFLILLKPLIIGWWPVRREAVIALWDYFATRLNSSFQLRNASLENKVCTARSVADFIEQAATLAATDSLDDNLDFKTNSFCMYLIILASVTRHFTMQSNKRNVQIIFNRIFLKLGPNKYENMTEQGIYNHGLLLLTMVSATSFEEDFPRISKHMQMVRIVDHSSHLPVDLIVKRIIMASQANMAVLVLLSNSSSFNKTAHIRMLLQNIDAAQQKYGRRLQPALQTIAEGTILMFEKASSKGTLNRGEVSLVGPWIGKYLYGCDAAEWYKLLDAIANALQNHFASGDGFEAAVNSHVHSFVMEQFSKRHRSPPCIARIAALLTKYAAICLVPQVCSAMFSNFINCPRAHSDQLLQYLEDVTKCSKTLSQLDEMTIIRQWLKMGLYYEQEELLEFSRVVCGLKEFKFLCEISECDKSEGKHIPIRLFFCFVAKRFREVDSELQMQMTIKLHLIFQHIDKWITEPNRVIRQRTMLLLILALKECPQAFYVKSNSSCLYHLAFQHYFLPASVLTDRDVCPDFIEDMAKVWHRVMDFLGSMQFNRDIVIGDTVNKMLIKWIPQFAKLPDAADALRPLLLFFCARNEELVLFSIPRLVVATVELQRCLPKPYAQQVVQMLQQLLNTLVSRVDHGKIALFIRLAGLQTIVHAFMCNATYPTRAIAMEMVYTMMSITDGPSNIIRAEMRTVLIAFTHKYLSMSAEAYFSFMCRLVDRNPSFMQSLVDMLREEVAMAERLRGQGTDRFLRNWLSRLEGSIDQSLSKQLLDDIIIWD